MTSSKENWKNQRVLVTAGGAGFIGSVLAWELDRRGCSQVFIADFPAQDAKLANLRGVRYAEIDRAWLSLEAIVERVHR